MRESRTYGSVRAKAEWLSYSTTILVYIQTSSTTGIARSLLTLLFRHWPIALL